MAEAKMPPGQRTLVGFGASTQQGAGDKTGGGYFARAEKLAKPSRPGWRWINRGIGGNTTRDMLARVSTVMVHAPYDLVVVLGCNDMPRANDKNPKARTDLAEYEKNLDEILRRVKGEKSLFITSFPVSQEKTGVAPETFAQYMNAAKTVAQKHGYEIWDLYTELLGGKAEQYWADDGLHFNDAGHQFLAESLWKRLQGRS
jgi:lysophospholipase L1-like esterase